MTENWLDDLDCSPEKRAVLAKAHEFVVPGRTERFAKMGVPLVIAKREGYRLWDQDGHELMDFHLNGGTYSLGHRHPDILTTLHSALETLDIGNHHFPSAARADLAEKLAALTPGDLHYSIFTSSGSEAIDVAINSARWFTKRRKIVALEMGFHGRSGLSGATGNDSNARFFLSDQPQDFATVKFDDLEAMEAALSPGDVAAVIMETIPATYGFPAPSEGYLPGVKALCEKFGTAYVADEVQTGLGRTGRLWGVESFGVTPDIMITGKGLSGGLYPVAATVLRRDIGEWLTKNPWGFVSTYGGSEIGCVVGAKVLDMCSDPETLRHVDQISGYLHQGLSEIAAREPFLCEIRQTGLVIGLRLDAPNGGVAMTRALYREGLWAMFAGFNPSVLQFKPGLLVDKAFCDEALERFERALLHAKDSQHDDITLAAAE